MEGGGTFVEPRGITRGIVVWFLLISYADDYVIYLFIYLENNKYIKSR